MKIFSIVALVGGFLMILSFADMVATYFGVGFLPKTASTVFVGRGGHSYDQAVLLQVVGIMFIFPFIFFMFKRLDEVSSRLDEMDEKKRKFGVIYNILSGKCGPRRRS